MHYRHTPFLLALSLAACLLPGIATAKVSADEAAKLGNELTPVGANPDGNKAGTIPKWAGDSVFTQEQKDLSYKGLEKIRQNIVEYGKKHPDENLISYTPDKGLGNLIEASKEEPDLDKLVTQIGVKNLKPRLTITADNYKQYADKLAAGYKKLFQLYPDYKMIVYPSVRGAYYPKEIYKATKENATRTTLDGTDGVDHAKVGFPYPIPKNGAQVIWNHKLKYRGSAAHRNNDQAVVDADGSFELTKVKEDVSFEYNNLNLKPSQRNKDTLLLYLRETVAPPRVAGQFILVHEIFGKGTSGRNAWIYNPGLGRVNRAPDVGFDNPSIGSDGLQFNDQVNMFNGALSRYNWKLLGKKEMFIPYNSYLMNNPIAKYSDIIQKGHINQGMARYELHRVWVVEADLKEGIRHQFAKRVFYVDEDSWGIALVDCYDARGQLWRFQEGHMLTAPFVPTTTPAPQVIYDLKSGRYFLTALSNEGQIPNFDKTFQQGYFSPSALKRRARFR